MGILHYGASRLALRVDDGTLAHLRVIVTAKLRRGESFALTWIEEGEPGLRDSIWMHPGADLMYTFDDAPPPLDNALLDAMGQATFAARGLEIPARRIEG